MKFLYGESESITSKAFINIFKCNNHVIDVAHDGEALLDFAKAENYDCIILNLSMPKIDGLSVRQKLSELGSDVPIIFILPRNTDDDILKAIKENGYNYIKKPFTMGEFILHVKIFLSQKDNIADDLISYGNIKLNLRNYELFGSEKHFVLPRIEYKIMELLILNRGLYVSTEDIFNKIWGQTDPEKIGIVWVYISYLRKRLNSVGANVQIKARRNIGYALVPK